MNYRFDAPTFRIVRDAPGNYRKRPKCENAAEAFAVIKSLALEPVESLVMIGLDNRLRAMGVVRLSTGTSNTTVVEPSAIIRAAILMGCCAVIVAHNHPSGDPTPSNEDILFTENLRNAFSIVKLPLLDSLIVGDDSFKSLLGYK